MSKIHLFKIGHAWRFDSLSSIFLFSSQFFKGEKHKNKSHLRIKHKIIVTQNKNDKHFQTKTQIKKQNKKSIGTIHTYIIMKVLNISKITNIKENDFV